MTNYIEGALSMFYFLLLLVSIFGELKLDGVLHFSKDIPWTWHKILFVGFCIILIGYFTHSAYIGE